MNIVEKLKAVVSNAKQSNPKAATAGEQDHTNPWVYAGDDADAPVEYKEDNN